MVNISLVDGKSIRNLLTNLVAMLFDNFMWFIWMTFLQDTRNNCSLSIHVNYWSLIYFSIRLTGRALVSSIALLIITGSIWATSLDRNLPGDVGLQLVQDGTARAEDLGLREATEAEVEGGEVRGRGDHSLPLKHILLITVSPNWLSRYLRKRSYI